MARPLIVPAAIMALLYLNLGSIIGVMASKVNTTDISNMIDTSVGPCGEFYEFACSIFSNNKTIFLTFPTKVQEQLKIIMEEDSLPTEPKPFRLVKNLYNACRNLNIIDISYTVAAIEAQSVDRFLEDVENAGGWPVLKGNQWNNETFDWNQVFYKLNERGYSESFLFDTRVGVNEMNRTKHILYLDGYPSMDNGVSPEQYLNFLVDITVMLGADPELARQDMAAMVEFEMSIENLWELHGMLFTTTRNYSPMTIAQLSELAPTIAWKEHINHLLPPSIRVNDTEIIMVSSPDYFSKLAKLFEKTPTRIQANLIMMHAFVQTWEFLNAEINDRVISLLDVDGNEAKKPRWQKCVNIVLANLPIGVRTLYASKHSQEETKRYLVERMISAEQAQLADNSRMTCRIAYPGGLGEHANFGEYYRGLEVSHEHYLQGILNITLFSNAKSFSQLTKSVNVSDSSCLYFQSTIE